MKQDELFSEGKEFSDSFLTAAKNIGRGQLKTRFNKLNQPTKVKRFNIYWIAASIAILIAASIFLFKPSGEENLYASYYHKLPNKMVVITRGNAEQNDLKLAFIAYEQNKYGEASDQFLALSDSNPDVNIYQGIIAMEELEFNSAIDIFNVLLLDPDYRFIEDAKWYLALCHIRNNSNEKARYLLQEVKEGGSEYATKAQELLNKI